MKKYDGFVGQTGDRKATVHCKSRADPTSHRKNSDASGAKSVRNSVGGAAAVAQTAVLSAGQRSIRCEPHS